MTLLLLATLAFGGELYINGTRVDSISLANQTLQRVDLQVDAQGNIFVNAPGYTVEVLDPSPGTTATPMPTQGSVTQPVPRPMPTYVPTQPAPLAVATPAPTNCGTARPSASGVLPARWWLVTEDNASQGHTVEVYINDYLAATIRSGERQKIMDIGTYLVRGDNRVLIKSSSVNATGGTFYVYLSSGSDQSGTVVMDPVQIQFSIGSSRQGPYTREYTMKVPG